MADATKYQPLHSRTLISDLKNLFTILKTRRTSAFVYVFMFAFVGFTVFLAFSPSSNSSAPWFTNIFSTGSNTGSVGSTSDSYRSQFSSLFSYFFPNNSSPQKVPNFTDSSPPPPPLLPPIDPQNNLSRSSNTTSLSPTLNRVPSTKAGVLKPNQTSNQNSNQTHKANSSLPPFPSANEQQPIVKSQNQNQAQNSTNSNKVKGFLGNQTTIMKPVASVVSNKSVSLPAEVGRVSNVTQKAKISNYTAPLSKKQSNETKSVVSVKQGSDDLVKSLMGCDFFDGEWVKDDSYPLYKPGSCSLIDEQFNCIHNGRHDKDYQKYKWKPKRCTLPRLDGKHLLNLLRGKRLVFVGDSLNRNMWESLVCILRNSAKDPRKVFEAHGRHHFRGEASYSFVFKDYDCTVEFFVSPFLVQEWEMPDKNGLKKETLRLDLVGRSSDFYKDADVIIFNTGHWWTHDKTSKGKDYYQEGSHVYGELNVLEAFRKALTTWARWVDANVNPTKSIVFFRGYSASHFSGGQWNSGGQCDHETEPIMNETYLNPYPPKMMVLEKVLRNMKTHVNYLNITRMTDFRKDGHPSIYRKQNLSPEERRSPSRFQDCSHWCLPGVPDAWNEAVYAQLLVKLQQQKKA